MAEKKATQREGQTKHIEREFEIGKDEAWFANIKRVHDEYLNESLDGMRKMRTHFDRMVTNAMSSDQEREKVSLQALQNAVTVANNMAHSAVNLYNVAGDRMWNLDEVSKLASQDTRQVEALATILATKLAEMLGANKS